MDRPRAAAPLVKDGASIPSCSPALTILPTVVTDEDFEAKENFMLRSSHDWLAVQALRPVFPRIRRSHH